MNVIPKTCLSCGGNELYCNKAYDQPITSQTQLYPGLGAMFRPTEMAVVLCRDCGHTSIYAEKDARDRVAEHSEWKKL